MHLNDALGINLKLEPIVYLHKQACGIAMEAAGKLLSAPSAFLATCYKRAWRNQCLDSCPRCVAGFKADDLRIRPT